MNYVSLGTELFYEQVGSGPDVVLLHPTPVHHAFWLPVAERLRASFRVTLPDLRGHGRSEAGEGPVTMARLAADVEALLEAAGIARAAFAGCSIGSYALYELWRRMPDRIDALAFCNGKPQADTAANRAKRQETIAQIASHGPAGFFGSMEATAFGPTAHRDQPERIAEARAMMDGMRPEAVIAVQQGLAARPDSVPTLGTITVPVMALAAAEDPLATPAEMRVVAEEAPGAVFHLLAETGHYAPFEQPERVSGLLGEFLARLPGA